jgi:hypothetical protein
MHKLSVTMSENSPLLCVPSGVKWSQYILKGIRKRGNIGYMIASLRWGFCTDVLGEIPKKHVDRP